MMRHKLNKLVSVAVLGLDGSSQTTTNLMRTGQCVLNLAPDHLTKEVNALARTTGTENVPSSKMTRGYRHIKDKFGFAGLTAEKSDHVSPSRIRECPVQMEAELVGIHDVLGGAIRAIEVKILKTWVTDDLRLAGKQDRIDPDAWHPMIMSFQHLYGLRRGKLEESKLAGIDEELYRPANLVDEGMKGQSG